jgi:hypothetical protein
LVEQPIQRLRSSTETIDHRKKLHCQKNSKPIPKIFTAIATLAQNPPDGSLQSENKGMVDAP